MLQWGDGHVSEFDFMWLRDHCPTRFDSNTRQRAQLTSGIPLDVKPASVSIERQQVRACTLGAAPSGGDASAAESSDAQDVLVIEWSSDSGTGAESDQDQGQGQGKAASHFQLEWLRRACYSEARRSERRRPWSPRGR